MKKRKIEREEQKIKEDKIEEVWQSGKKREC